LAPSVFLNKTGFIGLRENFLLSYFYLFKFIHLGYA